MIRRAVIQTLVSRQIGLVFMGAGLLLLARLLTPEDFGAFAVAFAIFAAGQAIAEFGLEARLVRDRHVDDADYGSAVGLGLAMALLVVMVGGAVCALLPEAVLPMRVKLLLAIMAPAMFATPARLMVEPRLARDLKFGLISVASTGQIAVEVIVGIGLAFAGWGAFALAAAVLVSHLAAAGFMLLSRRSAIALPSVRGWRRYLAFSWLYAGTTLLTRSRDMGVTIIVGAVLGLGALGVLNRAFAIITLLDRSLLTGLKQVILPAISRTLDDGVASATVYLAKIDYLCALMWPVFAGMAILAEPLVHTLLGDQWTAAIPVVRILCLVGVTMPFNRMSLKIFAAIDKLPLYIREQAATSVLALALVAFASFESLVAVAWALVAGQVIRAAVISYSLKRAVAYSSRAFIAITLRAGLIAGVVAAAAGLAAFLLSGQSHLVVLVGGIAACTFGLLLAIYATQHPLIGHITVLSSRVLPATARAKRTGRK